MLVRCIKFLKFAALSLIAIFTLISPIFLSGFAHAATNPKGQTTNGMQANLTDAMLNNYGTIIGGLFVRPVAEGGFVGMYGIDNTSFNFSNTGTINIEHVLTSGSVDTFAYGMVVWDVTNTNNHTLSNTGSINVNLSTVSVDAWGGGMAVIGAGSHILNNFGDIFATFSVRAIAGNDNVLAYGMRAKGVGNHRLTNSGNITAMGTITNVDDYTDSAKVYGIHAEGGGSHNLINSGNITTIATSSGTKVGDTNAYGMSAEGGGNHTLTNSSNITVTATTTATDTDDAEAYGMHADGTGNHNLSSSGTILATAIDLNEKAVAYGMYAEGAGNHNLSSVGTIIATASGGSVAVAYGMYVQGTPPAGTHNLSNMGIIIARAMSGGTSKAYEAYGEKNYSIGTWATTLRTWTGTDAVFGADDGVIVNFDSSKLILRPDTAARGFVLGKDYAVASMVSTDGTQQASGSLNVSGTISSVATEVPFLTATLTGTNANTATVRLNSNVNKNTVLGAKAMQAQVDASLAQFGNVGRALSKQAYNEVISTLTAEGGMTGASAGSAKAEYKWLTFLKPYANFINNSELDYDGNAMGITAGASYRVSDKFSLGAHFDLNFANIYMDIWDTSSKSTSFALGVHTNYKILPEWYISAQLTGAISQTDSYYELNNATPTLNGQSNYNGEALYVALNTGYVWKIANGHSLTPEIGVSYLGMHTGAYDIAWDTPLGGIYDFSYDDAYYNAFYGNINLNWRSQWELEDNSSIAFVAGLGLRQNLSASAVETSVRALGSSFTFEGTKDFSTFLADVGLEYKKGGFSVSLNYEGSYGYTQTGHGGNVLVKLEF